MKKLILISSFLLSFLIIGYSQGELEAKIQKERVAFFENELQLSQSEADQFWPLYDQYRADVKALKKSYRRDKKVALMSDKEVEAYIFEAFEMQEKQIGIRKTYYEKLRQFMPIRKIAMLDRTEQKFKKKLLQHVKQRRQQRKNGPRNRMNNK